MSGIGVIIIILQLAQLVGQPSEKGIVAAIRAVPEDFGNANGSALMLGLATMAIIYAVPKFTKKPYPGRWWVWW